MNNKLVFVLVSACGILAAVIVAEWLYALHVREQVLAPLPSSAATAPLAQMPTIDLLAKPEESYVDLVERPLFIKGRRPVEGAADGQPQTGAAAPGQFDWQLVGVYTPIGDETLQALFAREKVKLPKDNFRKLAEGALLDGWHVVKIEQDKVTLEQDGNQKVLPLRKAKPKKLLDDEKQLAKPVAQEDVLAAESVESEETEAEPLNEEEFVDEENF